ncbi:MAG: hypothetical protein H0X40_05560 [Chthoniobacterales bacterium]|nr:hypothetical protein [Chthoniobacterales bacterium]
MCAQLINQYHLQVIPAWWSYFGYSAVKHFYGGLEPLFKASQFRFHIAWIDTIGIADPYDDMLHSSLSAEAPDPRDISRWRDIEPIHHSRVPAAC